MSAQLDRASETWRRFAATPPPEEDLRIAIETYGIVLVLCGITDIGRAGRLDDYRPHFLRFLKLREQSHRLMRAEAA